MSLYTRHRDRCTDITAPHASLMASMWFVGAGRRTEHAANAKLDSLQRVIEDTAAETFAFVVFTSDTDCDGTTYQAQRVYARHEDDACRIMAERGYYDVSHAVLEADWRGEPTSIFWTQFDDQQRDDYRAWGYASLGARWNSWVYDDTIGIPALDSRYDD